MPTASTTRTDGGSLPAASDLTVMMVAPANRAPRRGAAKALKRRPRSQTRRRRPPSSDASTRIARPSCALIAAQQNPDPDPDESAARDPANQLGAHVLGNGGTRHHAERRGEDERCRRRCEDRELRPGSVRRIQKSRQLGLVAELGEEDGREDRREELEVHADPRWIGTRQRTSVTLPIPRAQLSGRPLLR